jgi:hypothetical protein
MYTLSLHDALPIYLDSLEDIGLKVGQDLKFLFCKGEYELYEVVKG